MRFASIKGLPGVIVDGPRTRADYGSQRMPKADWAILPYLRPQPDDRLNPKPPATQRTGRAVDDLTSTNSLDLIAHYGKALKTPHR